MGNPCGRPAVVWEIRGIKGIGEIGEIGEILEIHMNERNPYDQRKSVWMDGRPAVVRGIKGIGEIEGNHHSIGGDSLLHHSITPSPYTLIPLYPL